MRLPWRSEQPPDDQLSSSSDQWASSLRLPTKETLQADPTNTISTLQRYTTSTADRLITEACKLTSHPALYPVLSGFILGSASALGAAFVYRRYFRRLRTAEWVTPDVLGRRKWVKGIVTSVGDADNFRLYHTPGFGWRFPLKFRRVPTLSKELKDQTIHIRIAGVDAPEASHFGRPAQPYAEEAFAWLKSMIHGKAVYCQLIRRDQYSRIVSVVTLAPSFLPGWLISGRSLALEMLRAGVGTTYEQAGAEYGKYGKDEFLRVEAEARAARRGMWTYGTTVETPAQYKRRHAQGGIDIEAQALRPEALGADAEENRVNWLRRILQVFRP